MPCPQATGGCTVIPDGACLAPKTQTVISGLSIVSLTWNGNGVDIVFNNDVSFPDQEVHCYARKDREKIGERTIAARDLGVISTPTGFTLGDEIQIFLRPETSTEFGEWQLITYTENVSIYPTLNFSKLENSQYLGAIL